MTTRTEEARRTRAFVMLFLSIFALMSVVGGQMLMQPVAANTHQSFTLYAGKTTAVGQVLVSNDGTNLYVEYVASAGWAFTEVHLAVATSLSGIPQRNGNPPPGEFKYSATFSTPATDKLFTIPLIWGRGSNLYIAAQAEVTKIVGYNTPTPVQFAASLPATADFSVRAGTFSYVTVNILSPAGISGLYTGWCASTTKDIFPNTQYTANVYSSYDTAKFAGEFKYPGNMTGPVNWLINQNVIGTPSPCTGTQYTSSDIQLAIWLLAGEPISQLALSTLGPYDMARANCLVQAALEHPSFYPQCGQSIAIVLVPTDGSQDTVAQIQLQCYPVYSGSDTAWAGTAIGELPFPGKNWATYFTYTVA